MLSFPNCKINLGLHVTAKRPDGYHDLETVFYPVQINDVIEIVQANELKFTSTGLPVNGDASDNLCMKAYQLLQHDYPQLPLVHIHLHKVIPMGAGLGGGSSDGAFMLALLNKKFNLGISEQQLITYALQLGSDCPFFIINKPCYATGRGEALTPVDVDLSSYKILVIHPGIHISTKDAFAGLNPAIPENSIKQIIQQPIDKWKNMLVNDFESTIFPIHPVLQKIRDELYNAGALYASMTGTGSSVYGIFNKDENVSLNLFRDYFHQWA